jgi:PAS domain S-box-containing protein
MATHGWWRGLLVVFGLVAALVALIGVAARFRIDMFGSTAGMVVLGLAAFFVALILVSIYELFFSDMTEETAGGLAVPAYDAAPQRAPSKPPEEALPAASGELFSELYMNSPVPYMLIGVNGTITSINMASVRLFGMERAQMQGLDVFRFIEGETPDKAPLLLSKLTAGLFINSEEMTVVRDDQSRRFVLLSLFPFLDDHGQRAGLLTLVDITKQKEIDKAKSEFVSLASHQLKTPITIIKWNLELLDMEKTGLSEKQQDYIAKARFGVERMEAIVEDFLNVSRLELGTLVMHPVKVDLPAFLDQSVTEYGMQAKEKQVNVVRRYDEHITEVELDPNFFRMAIGNLVSNAVKYTREGGTVTLSTKPTERGFEIAVTDTGIGIPADEQDKIFSKVFRASNARQYKTEGTGLGLYVVKEVVEALDGTIAFSSKENVGTIFTIDLPLYQTRTEPKHEL